MIVDQICYDVTGGAAGAAQRIHGGLVGAGVDSRYWHSAKIDGSTMPATQPIRWARDNNQNPVHQVWDQIQRTASLTWAKRRHRPGPSEKREYFSLGRLRHATPFPTSQLTGDVLAIHWVGKLFDYPTFFKSLPADRPIVWVLHDMNPFTGGCHFSGGCERFQNGCGHCPQLDHPRFSDPSARTLKMKTALYRDLNLHVVAPSRWLGEQAKQSMPFKHANSHHVIPYGIDVQAYAPIDKAKAKAALQIDPNRTVIAFAADSATNRRKGFHHLMEAWPAFDSHRVEGIMFGGGDAPALPADSASIRHFGYVHDLTRKQLLYSAADVFVMPSLEDNLPQTGLEASASETPVVAFDAGGIPDYVRPNVTGLLAPTGNSDALATQIQWMIDHPVERRTMGIQAREMMVEEFAGPVETARYQTLFREIVSEPIAREKRVA
ncbi:Capsular glucan synthase [Planctomycetes bacterium CA13]|uniref:Capsular glucan synthase n=1 Tax=Novipirellula herctigrandis TaxID=2527986 RepID=A0A5C5Z8M2_9BACT|nr:Capsular glucan synthase [Planctomycetes bacterium CA13]